MVIETVLRTESMPAAERFTRWCEVIARSMPTAISSSEESDFRATARVLDLGAVSVLALSHPPLRTHRTQELIRRRDPHIYQLSLTVRGHALVTQEGRTASAAPGEIVLCESSRPFRTSSGADRSAVEEIVVQVPKQLLPIDPGNMSRITAVRMPAVAGAGALLARHLTELVTQGRHCRVSDAPPLGDAVVDLLTALCTHSLGAGADVPGGPDADRELLRARIHAFIERHLADPCLSPHGIAAAHQISTRTLYRLFQADGLGVAAWVSRRRLERCRRDLLDCRLSARPVHAIAARWCFTDAPHFSRAFRAQYGTSPGEYRRSAADGGA
ncbi:helix-turn-helix domain-containing protein [Streptomyces sp. NPDC096176]|uniref:AraC-like ligand-binding domain-containing protein n=1 Tax=Streptomyces sp. NPDC096176 TaxID=3366079 RepID=UPI0037F59487